MGRIILYEVAIPVEEGGEIERRIKALAERSGASFEQELGFAVVHGINHHIRSNLRSTETLYETDK